MLAPSGHWSKACRMLEEALGTTRTALLGRYLAIPRDSGVHRREYEHTECPSLRYSALRRFISSFRALYRRLGHSVCSYSRLCTPLSRGMAKYRPRRAVLVVPSASSNMRQAFDQ